jgi:hypothetical protein
MKYPRPRALRWCGSTHLLRRTRRNISPSGCGRAAGPLATSQDNFGIASRLAKTLSVELVNVEGRRAPRANPDAVDLTLRGWSVLNGGPNQDDVKRSVAVFEDALRIDPDNSQASVAGAGPYAHPPQSMGSRTREGPGACRRSGHAGHLSRAQLRTRALREGRGSRIVPAIRRGTGHVRQAGLPER